MKRVVLSSIAILCTMAAVASAATLKVPSEYPSIQAGIDAAVDGDTVVVSPGLYYETINFSGKNITVTSTNPDDRGIVGYTIINAEQDGSAVTFDSGETPAAVLTGFTITGGLGTLDSDIGGGEPILWGGGIYCSGSSPTITKNVIAGNRGPTAYADGSTTASYGCGIACINSNAIITCNTIRNNVAFAGAGFMSYLGQPILSNNLIYDNSAYIGGGLVLFGGILINNTISGNDCSQGQGDGMAGNIYATFEVGIGAVQLINNIICNAPDGGGVLIVGDSQGAIISCNNVWNNSPGNYIFVNNQTGEMETDGSYDQTGKRGNISVDPKFLNAAFSKDFHLTFESSCINAGDSAYATLAGGKDIDGQDRVYGGRIDIGADEYVGYIKPVANAGYDQHIIETSQLVTLNGGQSFFYDPCGVRTFHWTQISGPAATLDDPNAEKPAFVPSEFGEYVFELVVADDRYEGAPDQVLVLVGANLPPVANAGTDRLWQVSAKVTLDGTNSLDPDVVDRLTYQWTQVEGPSVELADADSASPSFVAEAEGQYVFELVVSDGYAQSAPSRVRCIAVSITATAEDYDVTPSQGYGPYQPDVSGMKVVYEIQTSEGDVAIIYKDMTTGKLDTLVSGTVDYQPKIDGDFVVWYGGISYSEYTGGPMCAGVYIRDISTGVQRTLRYRSDTASYSHAAISGDKVVWVQHVGIDRRISNNWYNMPFDICGADVSNFTSPVYFTVATNAGRRDPVNLSGLFTESETVVDICGDIVVWEGDGNIYAADISDLENIKVATVCDNPARQYDPSISGHFVVWTDERNDAGDIYGADLSNFDDIHEFVVAKASGVQQQARIDGPLVVYVENNSIRFGCVTRRYGVLGMDLPTRPMGVAPALDGRTVVWLSSIYGPVQGAMLDLGYSISDGPVQNLRTGLRYDYLQHAVTEAADGDEIVASPGVYEEKVGFAGKAVTIRSEDPNDPAVVASTILRSTGSTVAFTSHEEAGSVLDGFTVTGGNEAVYCWNSLPTLMRCTITGSNGAGVRLVGQCSPTFIQSRIVANGGSGIEMAAPTSGRVVRQNEAMLRNCLIAGNGGRGIYGGIPTAINCTIVENMLEGISGYAPTVTNSIVFFNRGSDQIKSTRTVATYSDVQGGWDGDGNIDADPLFVSPGQWNASVWTPGDYHLKTQGWRWDASMSAWTSDDVTSPCIDAGDPTAGLLDEPVTSPHGDAVINIAINMGVYGGTAEASVAPANP